MSRRLIISSATEALISVILLVFELPLNTFLLVVLILNLFLLLQHDLFITNLNNVILRSKLLLPILNVGTYLKPSLNLLLIVEVSQCL